MLVDARHGVKPLDAEIMQLLDRAAVTFQVVLTKADKLAPAALAATVAGVARDLARHPAAFPEIVVTSAETGRGIADPARPRRRHGADRRSDLA